MVFEDKRPKVLLVAGHCETLRKFVDRYISYNMALNR